MENYDKGGLVTDDNITRRMRYAYFVTKTTDTHSEYVIRYVVQCKNGSTNAPQYFVVRALPALLPS
jgi:hypothetical protein